MSQDCVVGILTRLRAARPRNRGLIPGRGKRFYSSPECLDEIWGRLSLSFFAEGKSAGSWSSLFNSIQWRGSECVELCLHFHICFMVCAEANVPLMLRFSGTLHNVVRLINTKLYGVRSHECCLNTVVNSLKSHGSIFVEWIPAEKGKMVSSLWNLLFSALRNRIRLQDLTMCRNTDICRLSSFQSHAFLVRQSSASVIGLNIIREIWGYHSAVGVLRRVDW